MIQVRAPLNFGSLALAVARRSGSKFAIVLGLARDC